MSKAETAIRKRELTEHESRIEAGIQNAYRSLEVIRDKQLYGDDYETFEAYCKERWGITRQRAYQLIDASKIAAEVSTNGLHSERSMRILKSVPEGERKAVWDKAVEASPSGKPTAAAVKSIVNGVHVADPKDIAKARTNGKIPHDAIVTVVEPDEPTTIDEVAEEHEERKAQSEDELSDKDWLETLPLASKLDGYLLRDFKIDALAFRNLEPARQIYLNHARRAINKQHKGPFGSRVIGFAKIEPPQKWNLCPSTQNGGCGGKGLVSELNLKCTKCNGCGYWISGRERAS